MTENSFEHKIKASLDAFEDTTPPSFAEWNAVASAIGSGSKRGFGFYAWRALAGLAALLLLLFGGKLFRDNRNLQQKLAELNQKVEFNNEISHTHTGLTKDTVVLIQKQIDTIYIIQKPSLARDFNSNSLSQASYQKPQNAHAIQSKTTEVPDEGSKIIENRIADSSKKPRVKSNSTTQQSSANQSSSVTTDQQNSSTESLADAQQKAEPTAPIENKESPKPAAEEPSAQNAEEEAEEEKQKRTIATSSYLSLAAAKASPYAHDIKETNLSRVSGEYEFRIADRIGFATGFQYSFLKYEHHLTADVLTHFPDVDMSYFDLYTTINGLNVPMRVKLYVLPDKTLTPFISVGLLNQVWHQSKYRFTDSPLYAETNRIIKGFELKPQFALFGLGMTVFNKNNFGGEIEVQYNHGLTKSGFADPGINAFGGSLRLFYRLN